MKPQNAPKSRVAGNSLKYRPSMLGLGVWEAERREDLLGQLTLPILQDDLEPPIPPAQDVR